jgi:aerobic-type carbon monoxide dehydrogenase small subunit (CoxS/CutS family)
MRERDRHIEGLGTPEHPHPVQKAFIEEQAFQCGYCLNGWVITTKALLDKHPHPTDEQMKSAFEGSGLPLRQPYPDCGCRTACSRDEGRA